MPTLLRLRTRLGQLPGEVTARGFEARRAARRVSGVLCFTMMPLLIATQAFVVWSVLSAGSHTRGYVVDHVIGPPQDLGSGLHYVVMTDGHQVTVGEDPGVAPGQPVSVRYTDRGVPEALVVRGTSFDALPKPATGDAWLAVLSNATVLFSVGLSSVVAAQVWLLFIWANRDTRNLGADLREQPRRLVATYMGSSIPKTLLLRAKRTQSVSPGFPIAVRDDDGHVTWLFASLDHAARVRAFETELRRTSRRVTLEFYPHSFIVRSVTSDTGAQLDLGLDADEALWDSQAGLPIA